MKKLIEEIKAVYGENAEIKICREMTKKFEEVSDEVTSEKGEMVIIFS